MARLTNIKYQGTFKAKDSVTRTVQIIASDWTGATTTIKICSLALDENNTENILSPVRTWSGTLSFYNDINIELSALMPKNAKNYQFKVLKGQEVEFIGYVASESLAQTYNGKYEVISLAVYSRLAIGGGLEYDDTINNQSSNVTTIANLLYGCLKQCGVEDTNQIYFGNGFSLTSTDNEVLHILGMKFDRFIFYSKNTNETEPEKTYDKSNVLSIIEEILKPFGFVMHEVGDKIVCFHVDQDATTNNTSYSVLNVGYLPNITTETTASVMMSNKVKIETKTATPYTTNQQVDFYRGRKKLQVTYDFAKQDTSNVLEDALDLNNYDFYQDQTRRFKQSTARPWTDQFKLALFQPINKKYTARTNPVKYVEDEGFLSLDNLSGWNIATQACSGSCLVRGAKSFSSVSNDASKYTWGEDSPSKDETEYFEALMINPCVFDYGNGVYEDNPDLPRKNFRVFTWTSEKDFVLNGGNLLLNFNIEGYKKGDEVATTPSLNKFRMFMVLRVGGKYYVSPSGWEASPDGSGRVQRGTSWRDTENIVNLYLAGSSAEQKSSLCEQGLATTIDGVSKSFYGGNIPCPTTYCLKGKMQLTLYVSNAEDYVGLFLKDLSLKYEPAQTRDTETKELVSKTKREYYQHTQKGFEGDEMNTQVKIGSYGVDSGFVEGTLLTYDHINNVDVPLKTIYKNGQNVAPEQALLDDMVKYYDRIQEIRTITIEDAISKVNSGDLFSMDGKVWIILATSIDYYNGTRTLTITEKL